MSLYLKYRPATFDGLVGQDALKSILLHQIKTDQVFHNYLFCGGRGTGKTSTARLLAQAVNCSKLPDGSPDFNDPIAAMIREGKTIDVIEIDAASHTGVDNIREEIIEKSSYPPAQLKKKVYIIDEVHMLSKGAFNALLKIMEEPPSYLMFILATTELHKVPETIVSRCQVFNFKHMTPEQVVDHLRIIADKEGIQSTHAWLAMIAKLSGGAMRDAIKYLEQVSMLGDVTPAHVSQFLGVASDDAIQDILSYIVHAQYDQLYSLLETLAQNGTDMLQLVKDCMLACNDHFNKNPVCYAQLASQLKDLFQNYRRYPNGILAWKVTFKDIREQSQVIKTRQDEQQETKEVIKLSPASKQKHDLSTKQEHLASSSTTTISEWWKELLGDEWGASAHPLIDFDQLLESMIKLCDKTIISSWLKNYTMIDRIHDNILEAVIINEQFYHLMNKQKILAYLSDIIIKAGYGNYQLRLTYMSKEDYLNKHLIA